jgi:hypothetical protein
LIDEVIPTLETGYRMDSKPSGRILTGHSSCGWFALWAMVRYPKMFGGSWPTSPDPSDFHDFLGVDLHAAGANMYRDVYGTLRPIERDHDKVLTASETVARAEAVLGALSDQMHQVRMARLLTVALDVGPIQIWLSALRTRSACSRMC